MANAKLSDMCLVLLSWLEPMLGMSCSSLMCVCMCTEEHGYSDFKVIDTHTVECVLLFLCFPSQILGLKACASMPSKYALLPGKEYSAQALESAISSRSCALLLF